jgi:hypothetical protein
LKNTACIRFVFSYRFIMYKTYNCFNSLIIFFVAAYGRSLRLNTSWGPVLSLGVANFLGYTLAWAILYRVILLFGTGLGHIGHFCWCMVNLPPLWIKESWSPSRENPYICVEFVCKSMFVFVRENLFGWKTLTLPGRLNCRWVQ